MKDASELKKRQSTAREETINDIIRDVELAEFLECQLQEENEPTDGSPMEVGDGAGDAELTEDESLPPPPDDSEGGPVL